MQIKFHKNFEKSFKKLSPKLKQKTNKTIEIFAKNPYEKSLKNHPLKGLLKDLRAISVTGDLRIIFKETDNYTLVIMLNIGIHNKIYS